MIEGARSVVIPSTLRPYRLWDSRRKQWCRGRYYAESKRAHWGAIKEIRFAKLGTVVELVNVQNGRLLCQYIRVQGGIDFQGE